MNISIAPEIVMHIGPFGLTNSMATALLITGICILLAIYAQRRFRLIPTRLQVLIELAGAFVMEQTTGAFQSKEKARLLFPYLMTLFVFIFIANQLTVIPLIGQIVYGGHTLFRTATSDVSETLALALLTVGLTHLIALRVAPLKHLGNYIKIEPLLKARSLGDFGNALLEIFLGLLDIIGEIAKVLSLSFRLFGNILAGELIITIIGGLAVFTKVLVPVPFMILSIFSGIVQAVVFMMLSVQFMAGTINSVTAEDEESGSAHPEIKVAHT